MVDLARRKQKVVLKRIASKSIFYVVLLLLSFVALLPFFWMLATSFKQYDEIFSVPVTFFARSPSWSNYAAVFDSDHYVNILVGFRNTLIIVVPSTIIGCLTAALAAFSFSRMRWKGRDQIFFVFVATMAIPGIILMIPSYILFSKIHWTNTWLPLMIPGMFGGAGAIFFTRQFMKGIPGEIDEAARIDGLSWWGVFWRIDLPLCKPVLVSNFLFGFIGGYNDWVGPELYLQTSSDMKTLQQMVAMLNDTFGTRWGVEMAGSCLALIPTILIFIFAQKFFVQGITFTGSKEG